MEQDNQLTTYQKCIADFPQEALSKDSSRGFDLTSVKAQYVSERLNEVFGSMHWNITGEYVQIDNGILYKGKLTVTDVSTGLSNCQESCGFAIVKKNVGDAFKGAQTDALSKCASRFGIANEVFKGNVTPPGAAKKAVKRAVRQPVSRTTRAPMPQPQVQMQQQVQQPMQQQVQQAPMPQAQQQVQQPMQPAQQELIAPNPFAPPMPQV